MPTWLRGVLEIACACFFALGVLVAFAGTSPLFAMWRDAAAQALFDRPALPSTLDPFVAATLGILGGSIAGKWVAAWFLVRGPLARGERWAWHALVAGLLGWFVLDSAVSASLGASFNVWMINLMPLVLCGIPLALARRHAALTPPPPTLPRATRALRAVCLLFAAFGVVVAVAPTSPVFGPYTQGIADAWYGGSLPAVATPWQAFIYAPIGATFLGHFVMLAWAVHRAGDRTWALRVVFVSMLAWFCIDSTTGVLHGAWFNLAMVNVPSLVAVMIPWWLARSGLLSEIPRQNAVRPGHGCGGRRGRSRRRA